MGFGAVVAALVASLHLVAAGLASIGPLLAAGALIGRRKSSKDLSPAWKQLAWYSVIALVLTAAIGFMSGALLYLSEPDGYGRVLSRFPHKLYVYTALEWLFSLVCYGVWYWLWNWGTRRPWLHSLLPLAGATNLLYHFPPLMTVQKLLIARPELIEPLRIERGDYLAAAFSPEVLARSLHFWGMALVVSAAVALLLLRWYPTGQTSKAVATVGLVGTLSQLVTGFAVLMFAPVGETTRMTGGILAETALLGVGIVVSFWILLRWAALVFRPPGGREPLVLAAAVYVQIVMMSFLAHF